MKMDRWLLTVMFLCGWGLLSAIQVVDPLLLPSPLAVADFLVSPSQWGHLAIDLAMTFFRLIVGFMLGAFLGISFGIAMGRSVTVYRMLEFVVDFCRSIPVAALFPLFLVFFGIGDASKIATTCWSTALIVLVHTMYGVRSCSPIREFFARTLGASRSQILTTIVIPESLPSIFAGLRVGLSIAVIVVIMTEMFLGTSTGLGHQIFNAALLYETPKLYSMIFLTGLLGYLLNRLFVHLEQRLLGW